MLVSRVGGHSTGSVCCRRQANSFALGPAMYIDVQSCAYEPATLVLTHGRQRVVLACEAYFGLLLK